MLIANNGLGAVKFIRSIRAYSHQMLGHDRAITLIAMATPEDLGVNAEHVRLADFFVDF